jgi:hypothetical protein
MNTRRPYLPRHLTLEQRFWAKVFKRGEDECWPWIGSKNKAGYGQLTCDGVHHASHRLAHELLIGPLAHRNVNHKCDNRACCNPKHLWNGTQSQNMLDALEKGRCSQLIYENVRRSGTTKEERLRKKAEREARIAAGVERPRDAFGRMVKPGAPPLPPRERDSRGFFVKRQP